MKPTTPKETLICGLVILAITMFVIAIIGSIATNLSVWSIAAALPAAYGLYSFYKKYFPKQDE